MSHTYEEAGNDGLSIPRALEPFAFTPQPLMDYRPVELRGDISPGVQRARDMALLAIQGDDRPAYQLPRMGRVFYVPVEDPGGAVTCKGTMGPNPGAKSICALQDQRWKQLLGGNGGQVRVILDDGLTLLTQYRCAAPDTLTVVRTLPESYMSFMAALREYRALELLFECAGIFATQPLGILRGSKAIPARSTEELEYTLERRLREQLPQKLRSLSFDRPSDYYSPSLTLDSGVLLRYFAAADRPQDYYDLAVAGKWEHLRTIHQALGRQAFLLAERYAKGAGQMANSGVLHGGLYFDYQNLTMAGEMCDVQLAVIAPSLNSELADEFRVKLQTDDAQYGTRMWEDYSHDLASIAPHTTSEVHGSNEQSYYLFNAALHTLDLSRRAGLRCGNDRPGTVLGNEEISAFREAFAAIVAGCLKDSRIRRSLGKACFADVDINTQFRAPAEPPMMRDLLDRGLATILGWTNPNRPFNHYAHQATEEDVAFILEDYDLFRRSLAKALDR